MDKKQFAFIGAYERDNFGDLLFPWVTARLLEDVEPTLLAAYDGTVDGLVGHTVRSRADILPDSNFDALWTVGGEIASATGSIALQYAFDVPTDEQRRQAAEQEFAYIPRPSQFASTLNTPLVINSAGLASTGPLAPEEIIALENTLREADFIGVREQASSDYLTSLGIDHTMAPDVVSTIRDLHPKASPSGHIAVQLNDVMITTTGPSALAEALHAGAEPAADIVLFAAGIAANHDSWEQLAAVQDALGALGRTATLFTERAPLAIVDLVSSARLVVATSLHCRIVACAYDVPRVSLENAKVTTYARTWDTEPPFDVAISELAQAIQGELNSTWEIGEQLALTARQATADAYRQSLIADTRRSARRLDALTLRLDQLNDLLAGVRNQAQGLNDRVYLAERGVVPFSAAVKGMGRRVLRGAKPSADFGGPLMR